jgi:pimeloyl-ACP methyl ester carboxylesterase
MKLAALIACLAACSSSGSSRSAPPGAPGAPRARVAPAPAFTPTAFTVEVRGSGRAVIFIPGLASPGAVWDGAVAHLGGTVQTHVLTLAGFAGQPPIEGGFLQQVHDQLVQYIAANHLERPLVVGHSLGGVMSLWLAETEPSIGAVLDVEGMPFLAATIDPSMTVAKAGELGEGMKRQLLASSHEDFVGFMHQFLAAMVKDPASATLLDDAAARSDQTTVATAFAELLGKDLRPDLATITAPVIIAAAGEGKLPPDQLAAAWRAQVAAIPHHELVIVEGAKHFIMFDQPDQLYALLDRALQAN